MKKISLFSALLLLITLIGCVKEQTKMTLEGFAFYENPYGAKHRAVSPEGIILQISERENYPEMADKNFWAEAVKTYLPQKGYKIMKEGGTQKGKYFIFLVPGTKYDYFYFVHFSVDSERKKIILTESGGQYALLKDYEEKLIGFVANN